MSRKRPYDFFHVTMSNGSIYTMDCDRFIQEIMARPGIWELNHPDHKNKLRVKRLWDEIHRKFPEVTVDDLRKRWKNLKDTYRKELKRLPQTRPGIFAENIRSCWRYFDALYFLREQFGFSQKEAEDPNQDADKYIEVSSQSPVSPASSKSDDETNEGPSTSKRKAKELDVRSEFLKIEKKKMKILEDEVAKSTQYLKSDNYHFLMSLLPEMDKLRPLQKMRLRTKISQAVLDEVTMASYDDHQSYNEAPIQDPNSLQMQYVQDQISSVVKEEAINMYE